jgi:hypothetical protein
VIVVAAGGLTGVKYVINVVTTEGDGPMTLIVVVRVLVMGLSPAG